MRFMSARGNDDPGVLQIFDVALRGRHDGVVVERRGIFHLDAATPGSLFVSDFTRLIDVVIDSRFDDRGVLLQRESDLRFAAESRAA